MAIVTQAGREVRKAGRVLAGLRSVSPPSTHWKHIMINEMAKKKKTKKPVKKM